ncbi:hypothetical protein CC85DRAFT_328733 [Cutaneotrichosporon oleaginosum]|uniref:DNA polymerase n=1 Tax=Cutaneotrichosporon oleaginosum TaxID=879819 RepID=A0A0J1B279_9TREE|nr:uncharacterized protein CC85DRAFT_328733 [Cutaneotrichosporon oleaginosum]KLT41724.1 hypothetical protein CC85DRAFT_328733 [Cutaneotrichosporon oleaginosum]TXT12322.1 hypothetical protein COLE_02732 [Cutaneotrichosporon oleaginosum]
MSSQGGPEGESALRLRITHIMTSQAPPLASLRSDYVPPTLPTAVPPGVVPSSFPVLRIFGTTTSRQKVCVNVHLAYPYFYVPFPMDSLDPLRPERVVRLCQRFAVSLNHAICLALRQNPTGPAAMTNFAGGTDPRHLHVVSVVLVKGVPFYGYHVGHAYWLKVSLTNPGRVRVAVEQLHKPVVLGKVWQPHEAHLSHVLQFMCDFDLYGCGFLDLSGGQFRQPLPEPGEEEPSGWLTSESIPVHMAYPPNLSPPRDTRTALELDVLPHHILNRHRLAQRELHHDFIELLHQPLHPEEKLVPAMKELWEDERRRRLAKGLGTSEGAMLPVSGGGRGRSMAELGYKIDGEEGENRGGDWKISEELWAILEERMAAERRRRGRLTFDQVSRALRTGTNGERKKYDRWIMTAFEAVSAGWPKRATQPRRTQKRSSPPNSQAPPSPPPEEEMEHNPFEFATQASQEHVEVEVDAAEVQEDHEEEAEPGERQHLAAVREAEAFRATQAAIGDDDITRFLKTQAGGSPSRASTPSRAGSITAGNTRSGSSGTTSRRRAVEEAGFGDLSSLALSSFRLSSASSNPFAPSTPTRAPNEQQSTPRSLVRDFFARHSSPLSTPTKPRLSPNTVVLPASKRSFTKWTPSPQEAEPSSPLRQEEEVDMPLLTEIKVRRAPELPPPNAQPSPLLPSSIRKHGISPTLVTRRPGPSPTMLNEADATPTQRPKKRVRLSSPTQPFVIDPSQSSKPASGGETSNSSAPDLAMDAWVFSDPPPSNKHVVDTMSTYGLDTVEYPSPFYSNPADVPPRPKAFAGRVFNVKTDTVNDLMPFEGDATPRPWLRTRKAMTGRAKFGWEYGAPPPCRRVVLEWCAKEDAEEARIKLAASQLAGPTQKNKYGFKLTQRSTRREQQNMSVLLLEVFAPSRGQLLPDPAEDEMAAVFFCFQNEDETLPDTVNHTGYHAGYVLVESEQTAERRARLDGIPCHYVESELDLINWVIDIVREWDPDVLAGWELHNASWGYVAARAAQGFGTDFADDISRLISTSGPARKDAYAEHHTSAFKVAGRHVINIWRILRSEVTLNAYTFENCVFHVLRQRVPHYTAGALTALWRSKTPAHTARVLGIMFQRVVLYAELIDSAEVVSKNAEFGRVFGVDFDAVVFRGSQFKVESFLFRLAKPESFILVTPSRAQVGLQNAPFAVPLIAEPESKYYSHPVIVLDFQSLYPSVMIAYNICYSTCLGRVEKFKGTDKFGFSELKVSDGMLELLKDYLTVTPNGMVFVKPAVRKSLLAKMLGEILDTRVMVKHAMKGARGDKPLMQLLNARQLALKLMANVTYGYTSATYSGRMPCVEIADSIVQTGRETLEKAQELIHSRPEWAATVVYGDTDSLFVSLPGRSKDEAFKIGHDIADAVTALNPKPVRLKFEKVYMGCILMAKKRYVGFKYEHPDETEPSFDAKGIETIRRDGCAAQAKLEEVCLKMLFRGNDLSAIKAYCRGEWAKILASRVSVQDFIIAKEVRLGTYSSKVPPPPGAAVAFRRILKDPRDEPQYAERVPYVISNAEGRRLIDRARTPEEMLASRALGIDAEYYIRNMLIPPLARIFNLVGGDVEQWYDSMPRARAAKRYGGAAARIDAHFASSHCRICAAEGGPVCRACRDAPDEAAYSLLAKEGDVQRRVRDLHSVCASCSSIPPGETMLCDSIDCPITYARVAAERDAADAAEAHALLAQLEW